MSSLLRNGNHNDYNFVFLIMVEHIGRAMGYKFLVIQSWVIVLYIRKNKTNKTCNPQQGDYAMH